VKTFGTFKFLRFSEDNTETILSWIQNEKDRVLWSGNSFSDSLDQNKFKVHLHKKDLFAFQLLDSQKNVQAYGEIVIQAIDRVTLCRILVNPKIRGKGLGKFFCQKLILKIKDWGVVKEISLNTLNCNKPALVCYKNLGFRIIAIKEKGRRIDNEWHDLIFMSLFL
jgi:RimJ/RimL family protein N-acetyltransferase